MGGHYCYITHFKGEKMEAQQDSVTCPSLSASKWQRIFFNDLFIYISGCTGSLYLCVGFL